MKLIRSFDGIKIQTIVFEVISLRQNKLKSVCTGAYSILTKCVFVFIAGIPAPDLFLNAFRPVSFVQNSVNRP